MTACLNTGSRTNEEHCWHPAGPPYGVQNADGSTVPAIVELCCHDGTARVKILRERPVEAEGHGEYLVFVTPKPAAPPAPNLIVPGRRVLH